MSRLIRQVLDNEENSSTTILLQTDSTTTSNSIIVLIENNQTNFTNGSIVSFSSNEEIFPWKFNLNFFILLSLGLAFVLILLSTMIWFWCHRAHRLRRHHSIPIAINDIVHQSQILDKHLSSNSIQAPPVPPRPTAYTTILGKVEYRSNL